ncbi:MAG: hypothetical protein ACXU82_00725 [Caulobacteraceae bacterium]
MSSLRCFRVALVLWGVANAAWAAGPPADRRNFVACPIIRDTKTVPCWLSEYRGELYYLGVQVDFGSEFWPPYLGHKVLVEGQVSNEPRICGGVVLKPIKISPLPEADENCRTMLPAEDRYTIPFATRGPGPNNRPSRAGLPRAAPAPEPAAPPAGPREFVVFYDFNNRIWNVRATQPMQQARDYALAAHAKRVEVVAYRGASLLSDGTVYVEDKGVAEMRARQLEEILQGVGVPASALSIRWEESPQPANGVDDPQRRKAVIRVVP